MSLAAPKLTLAPGEAAQLEVGLRPGLYHMIEVTAERVSEGGAEVVLRSGNVELPPLYFDSNEVDGSPRFAARVWSPLWPRGEESTLRVANYGPGTVTLDRVKARRGSSRSLYGGIQSRVSAPVSWTDLKLLQERGVYAGDSDALPPEEIEGAQEWMNQQRRRAVFESIAGPPIPVRMAEPIRGNVQVRGAALEASGAIVGLSRPNPTLWRALGPGWYPDDKEALWRPIPLDRSLPRGFDFKRGMLLSVAFYVANAGGERGRDGGVSARLFRLDSAEPVAEKNYYNVKAGGQWLELELDEGKGPGLYVFEVRAFEGAPVWLTWNTEPQPIADHEYPAANETLVLHIADPAPEYAPAIDVQARVVGSARRVEVLRGGASKPSSQSPGIDREIVLRAQLAPGETEIFYLQDYRNPVPARSYEVVEESSEAGMSAEEVEGGWWNRVKEQLGI